MQYEHPKLLSRAELEIEFANSDGDRILHALISAFYYEEPKWVQQSCLRFVEDENPTARRGAAIVLGNVSHVYAADLDLVVSLDALQKLKADKGEGVSAAAEDSLMIVLHMIEQLKWTH
jgi:hypothetical protein